MTKDKALKMAIDAMEASREAWHEIGIYDAMYDELVSSIQTCKEALEQPAHLTVPQQIEKAWDDAVGVVMPSGKVHLLKELVVGDILFKR